MSCLIRLDSLNCMLDIAIFNVEHGQSIFFYPVGQPEYGMFVDCGNTPDFEPIDAVIERGLLPKNQYGQFVLGNLTITNYDHDHFSGLPYLMTKAHVSTVRLAHNISTPELIASKTDYTRALDKVCYLKDNYIHPAPGHAPPYAVTTFSLPRHCFPEGRCDTNNLSQIVFVSYAGSIICISGDVEEAGWKRLLLNEQAKAWLQATRVLVAAHHGRENGYAKEIFDHCSPECVIFSDKETVHGTQEGMAQLYSNHVIGDGISFIREGSVQSRKVLTTRNDGHLWLRFHPDGRREYKKIV